MEVGANPLFVMVVVLATVAVGAMVAALVDLSRRQVRHLPKWAWALIIILVNFPLGAITYLVAGRVPPAEEAAPQPAVPQRADLEAARPTPREPVDPQDVVVATRGLSKIYGDTAALDTVDLRVPRGAI